MDDRVQATQLCLRGPAGTGKTSFALQHLTELLRQGVPAETVLVLVPQRALGRIYQLAPHDMEPFAGDITMLTLSGLARRNLERFWPLVAQAGGYDPEREPTFLTIETAQYYMMRFVRPAVEEGLFDSIGLATPRIAAQLLDNMAKAAIAGFEPSEVADRLIAAWGDRHSSRLQIYRVSQAIADQYLDFCRTENLLDYAAQLTMFSRQLLPHPVFRHYFAQRYQHLIADNIEEAGPLVHDFIRAWWEHWTSALLIMDTEGGYRTFLGASPDSALGLVDLCDEVLPFEQSHVSTPSVVALENEVHRALAPSFAPLPSSNGTPLDAVKYTNHAYYPQMIDWVVAQIQALIDDGVDPGDIAVLAPFLTDSLRFSLQTQLNARGIPNVSHRPSRALRDEPAARALLTLLILGHPDWGFPPPPRTDIADMLVNVIDGLDPVRARLLADIVYKPAHGGAFSSFDQIQPKVRDRITYTFGERFETLRLWLDAAITQNLEQPVPPDYFLSRLFGEVLSQAGFRFHTNLDGGRVAAQIIESARKFRRVLYPYTVDEPDWNAVGAEYLQLVQEGVLAALYTASWQDENADAVFLAPAFTFLMRNRVVAYQFWLDVGSDNWWKRLDQPLTHPYVLTREYPRQYVWTEKDEEEKQREMLYRLMTGLIRRCQQRIFLGISDLGEQGYEQRGPMLYVFQQILQRYAEEEAS